MPDLQVPDNVTVTSDVPTSFSISATDRDVGDTVTYRLVHDGNGALQIDSQTGEITATINSRQPVEIRWANEKNGERDKAPINYVPVNPTPGYSARISGKILEH